VANTFYQAPQVAAVAASLAAEDAFLSALVSRNFEDDLLGGGGKGRTVNVRIPGALIARDRNIDDKTTQIVLDELAESTFAVTLGTHAYSAVSLSEGDLSLNLQDFSRQVLAPQVDAVVDYIENEVAETIAAIPETTSIAWDPADPVKTFTAIRRELRKRGVPAANLNVVVGVDVYAALLDAKAITDASQSASTSALREGQVGNVRGFTVAESTRVGDSQIVAFHRDAFTLAVRAPQVPQGASFGATTNSKGFSLRYLRDYDVMTTADRSMVSTFCGVAQLPLYRVTRDRVANTATVSQVAGGAAMRVDTATAVPATV
jgi:hypothetical protein